MLRSIGKAGFGKRLLAGSSRTPTTNTKSTCGLAGEIYGPEHVAIQDTLRKIIEKDINPYVDEWEKAEMYPAHHVMKILGDAGILGVSHPEKYGGLGLGKISLFNLLTPTAAKLSDSRFLH